MRGLVFGITLLGAISAMVYAQNSPQTPAGEKGVDPIGSYGIGINIGRGMRGDGMQLNVDSFIQGFRDGLEGTQSKYPEEQIRAALETLQRQMQARHEQMQQSAAEQNKREGEEFLAKNKAKQGVVTLPSGLQYEVLRAGNGPSPKATDTVQVHYEGTLLDGRVFDSSIKRGQPAEFPVNGVIPGWTEALQRMKVGDKWRLFIPSDLAYGARGAGRTIGPNSVLIFEVELLAVKPEAKG